MGTVPTYRDVLMAVLSPGALVVLERLTPLICALYDLDLLLDYPVADQQQGSLRERLSERLERIVALLPSDVSPMANEVFTAVETLVTDVLGRELFLGEEIRRLELLDEAFRNDPLLFQLVRGRAN
ncbi:MULTISPECIES: hypothetical protein [Thermomicrobium]|jgi:hypothetical protein|uniref:Uncharacterized protein n=1 Tax=Thermomicrobium roseum (strain ATCC 27502 / DSM 5159 / P-2) TaxID=309801 RepID=B9KYQ1_THERP|nr:MULTISPECIES: hypothetical protein [Thermomicrobium]ACM05551.1 hypothetical protein trd_0601 [Thermomicrobium roseum DSM 5159]MBO9305748.1 hypothetical protein [Thermomicrobium sp.]MBO9352074.1 hypothetical protein [Thermomicrobium sp.]MBO9360527.1 hypothetical protein [Thermomicrobium sp.]MBO9405009.1 hypothetical protein [Thermomicrobium sp.]